MIVWTAMMPIIARVTVPQRAVLLSTATRAHDTWELPTIMEESSHQHCFFAQYAEADDGADMETTLTAIIRSAIREEQSAFYQVLTQQLAVQRLEQRQEPYFDKR